MVRKLIRDAFGDFEEVSDMALISAVGDGMSQSSGIIPTFLRTIRDNGTNCRLICSNALSITAAVEKKFVPELAKQLHDKLVVKANN